MKLAALLLLLLPIAGEAQTLVNCDTNTPCASGAPAGTGRGDTAAVAFSKVNAQMLNPLSQSMFVGSATAPYFNTLTPVVSGGYVGPTPLQVGYGWKANMNGTITGQEYYPVDFFLRDDEIVSNNLIGAVHVMHKYGASATGTHHGLDVDLVQTAADANLAGSHFFATGMRVTTVTVASDGGTIGTPNGSSFALNGFTQCKQTVQYLVGCIGAELDVQCESGSPGCATRDKIGLQIVEHDNGASVGASTFGAALVIASDQTVAGWQTGGGFGISFGSYNGYWPMNSSGTLIGCFPNQASGSCGTNAYGIDFAGLGNGGHSATFTGAAFASTGFKVDGSGNETANSWTAGGTTFTVSGCGAAGSRTGGATAGSFTVGTGASPCTFTVTLPTAPHGWVCNVDDATSNTHIPATTGGDTTHCVVKGNATTSDLILFSAVGY